MANQDPIFEPLEFRNLTIENRLYGSGASGVFDDVIREDPVDRRQMRTRRIFFWGAMVVIVVPVILGSVGA
jgi:hypothetical protein